MSRGVQIIGRLWQRSICWIANTRRRLGRGRWPDYVVFTLDGELQERTPRRSRLYSLLPFFPEPVTIESLTDALRRVAADPDVRGVLFLVKGVSMTLSQAQSLAALFDRFRRWGGEGNPAATHPKEVVVFLEQGSNALFAMASAADRVVLPPLTDWNVTGLHSEPTYLADSLAHLGVEFEVVKIAPWKTAFDRFNRASMSDAEADQFKWLLDALYEDLIAAIADGRDLPAKVVRSWIDCAPLTAREAREAGLIDAIAYEDELPDLLAVLERTESGGNRVREARLLPYGKARRYLLRRPRPKRAGAVGVLSLTGAIVPGKSRTFPIELPILGDSTLGSTTVQQQVRAALENDRLQAIVLHVDSGGGSALASDLMWRELSLLARKKPTVVYMGNVAASGGYYIATPGAQIVAQSATITGSIGVVTGKPVTRDAYAKMDAARYSLRRGQNADLFSDQEPWRIEQRQKIEEQVRRTYHNFKRRVANGRNLPFDKLDPICSGKVWTGRQALARGLVDKLGDFSLAVETACELADLSVEAVDLVRVEADGGKMPISAQKLGLDEDQQVWLEKVLAIARRDWDDLLGSERIWLIADGLPKIR